MKRLLLITAAAAAVQGHLQRLDGEIGAPDFEYFESGDDWVDPLCHQGSRQSPIDLPFIEEDIHAIMPRSTPIKRLLEGTTKSLAQFRDPRSRFQPLTILSFDANYGQNANVHVLNLSDTLWCGIDKIDGNLTVHESGRRPQTFKPT